MPGFLETYFILRVTQKVKRLRNAAVECKEHQHQESQCKAPLYHYQSKLETNCIYRSHNLVSCLIKGTRNAIEPSCYKCLVHEPFNTNRCFFFSDSSTLGHLTILSIRSTWNLYKLEKKMAGTFNWSITQFLKSLWKKICMIINRTGLNNIYANDTTLIATSDEQPALFDKSRRKHRIGTINRDKSKWSGINQLKMQ